MVKKFTKMTALAVATFMIASIALSGCSKPKESANTTTVNTTSEGTEPSGPPKELTVSLFDRGGIPAQEGDS